MNLLRDLYVEGNFLRDLYVARLAALPDGDELVV